MLPVIGYVLSLIVTLIVAGYLLSEPLANLLILCWFAWLGGWFARQLWARHSAGVRASPER